MNHPYDTMAHCGETGRNDDQGHRDIEPVLVRWYTYMLRCRDNTLYTGIARDLDKRIAKHNNGTGAKYTRSRRPVFLVYQEILPSRGAATSREYQLRQLSRAAKERLIGILP